ncbi:universal stress protein [Azospirillum brasilense]|uniref:universal stress protein n=1 Tax=Azospirillum brasilense TaxID=192 RepID=UPI00190C61DE|nr:universal stress protein [Azospirillum brasilense]MBK3732285.1 universal stress protein [Azospirillum brasilense]
MPIKTILLHMSNDDRHTQRLEVAVGLAKRFSAFVEVLFVATPVSMPPAVTGRAASYAYIAEATAIAHEKAGQIEQEVRSALKDCSYSWTVDEGDHVELLAARAAYADLAIVSQSHGDDLSNRVMLQVPDRLPLTSSCPTLVLPYTFPPRTEIGRHVVVAWKNTREAGRAVRNALPFLTAAGRVTVVTIDPPGDALDGGRDLMIWLERHGVRSQHQASIFQGGDVGEIILDSHRSLGGDLLVMGAYGHSRLREMVLGGATRTVLSNLTTPVLMAH